MAISSLLTDLKSELESGKILEFIGYPNITLLCKLNNDRYACVTSDAGTLLCGDKLQLLKGIRETFGEWLIEMPNWVVTTEQFPHCSTCGIPDLDGSTFDEDGICFQCREDTIPLNGKAKPLAVGIHYLKRDFAQLCEIVDALQSGQIAPPELAGVFERMQLHLNSVENMIKVFHSEPDGHRYTVYDVYEPHA